MIEGRSRSPEEWEREIERTRADIDRTLWALQHRLSRGAFIDRVTRSVNKDGGAFMIGLGRTIRDNPVPALVLGAGLAWLVNASRRANGQTRVREMRPAHRADPSRPTTVATATSKTPPVSPVFRDPNATSPAPHKPVATEAQTPV